MRTLAFALLLLISWFAAISVSILLTITKGGM